MAAAQWAWHRDPVPRVGRPAEHDRDEITLAAIALADADGLAAVSMRKVAATLGTGAASLYRHIANRDMLIDLMVDAVARYRLDPPSGDWLADLVGLAEQSRAIMFEHRWLAELLTVRSAVGPNGIALLEHVLSILADHPASPARKLEAFAVQNAMAATLTQYELRADRSDAQRAVAAIRQGVNPFDHPRLAAAFVNPQPPSDPRDRFVTVLRRTLTGLLGDST